jgi:hypothetical protein
MKENENSILQPVPIDRLISSVDPECSYFTSEAAKQFIRSGYLAAHFAKTLNLSIPGAFADGNVGVISGLNILAFLELDTDLSGVPNPYPLTYVGFSDFLKTKLREIYSKSKERHISEGLKELIKLTYDPKFPDYMIIYHPEFLSLEALASLYIESYRILRREMPCTGEDGKANDIIVHLHAELGHSYFQCCLSDPIMSGWRGESGKPTGLLGAFDLPAPPGAHLNLSLLEKSQRRRMKKLTMIAYGISSSTVSKKPPPPPPVYPRNPDLLLNPKEAVVVDTHRHCMVHLVEDETVYRFFQELPQANQTSLRNKKVSWRDGVHLLLYNFGKYPHHVALAFYKFGKWEMLDLPSRCPIPQIFSSPPFKHVDV